MGKRSWLAVAIAVGALVPARVWAQDRCSSAAPTAEEVNACAGRRARAVDSLRIEVESAIEGELEFERLQEFQRARELWREFRDTQCGFESREAGPNALLLYLRCHTGLTAERVERLSALLCEGGGLGGTCPAAEDHRAALRRLLRE